MKKLCFVATFLSLLVACGPAEQGVIKIGANLALTGKLAFYGNAEKNGIELAIQDINARGGIDGKQLALIIEDNQGDAKTAVTAMQKLLDVDKVDLVFTAFTHITQAVAPLAQSAGKVLLYQSTVADMARSHPLVFRDYMDIGEQGKELASYALAEGHANFAYIGEVSDVCEQFYKTFVDSLSTRGKVVLKQTFDSSETDFRTMLLKARGSSPQAFVFCAWRSEDLLMRQLEELQLLNIQTYHAVAPFLPSAASVNDLFKKNRAVSTWYGFGFARGTTNKAVKQFTERYRAVYGSEPVPDALFAYDDMMFLANALQDCKDSDAVCVANALKSKPHEGLAETVQFDKDGVAYRKTILIRYKDEGWQGV